MFATAFFALALCADVDPADHKAIKSKYLRLLAEKTKPEAAIKIVAAEYDATPAEIKKIVKYMPPKPKVERPAPPIERPKAVVKEPPKEPEVPPQIIGDVKVHILGARVGQIGLIDLAGDKTVSAKEHLAIAVAIENTSKTKKLDYQSWSAKLINLAQLPKLTDEHGNTYKSVHFGLGTEVVGQIEKSESVYPQKAISDVLIFEVPVEAAKTLNLTLPAANTDQKGEFKFRFAITRN